MTGYAAFLRAVNVGGSGKLPMLTLRVMVEAAGGHAVRTLGNSGNAVFLCDGSGPAVGTALGAALAARFGKPSPVFIRSAAQIDAILDALPFPDADPQRVAVLLLDDPVPQDPQAQARQAQSETLLPGPGCLFIHYPLGMGMSRLKHPAMEQGTARNLNTLRRARDSLQSLSEPK